MEDNRLSELYQKFINNTCSQTELELLFVHFGTDDAKVLMQLIIAELEHGHDNSPVSIQEAERLAQVHNRLKLHINKSRKATPVIFYWASVAAILIMALTFGLYINNNSKPAANNITVVKKTSINPGRGQATLTLSNGKKIVLTAMLNGALAQQGNASVSVIKGHGLTYRVNNKPANASSFYNTLTTARGEQSPYPLILPDGSSVWLNAASSITFPTAFIGKERVVKISGEVYFEVAHNAKLPFKVVTENQEIRVLGTHFNVKSYPDDATICTTLLQGSVKINDLSSGRSGMLLPGQQSKLDKGNRQIVIAAVNTDEIIAWKNGFFMFDNQRITSIMKSLSRWYDVEVEYKNFNNSEKFGGTFSRSSNLPDLLGSLQSLGEIHFRIDNRKIIVTN